MKRKYNLISSIISLSVTAFLLVIVSLAWYVTNTDANVDNGMLSIDEKDGINLSVKTYKLLDYEGNSEVYDYTKGELISEMSAYGDASSITATLLEIEYSISEPSNESYTVLIAGESTSGIISHDEFGDGTAYLSNAVNFTPSILDSNGLYVDLSSEQLKINKASSDNIAIGEINLAGKQINTSYYEYVVIDYDTNLVNDLYTALLQSSNKATLSSAIEFVKDLSIVLN